MIPEARRATVLKRIEESLGTKVEHLDSSSLQTRSTSEDSQLAVKGIQSGFSECALVLPMENRCYGPVSQMISQSSAASPWQSHQRLPSYEGGLEDLQSVTVTSFTSAEERNESRAAVKERANEYYSTDPEALGAATLSRGKPSQADKTFKSKTLSRMEIFDKIGCQPKDRIEEAVCALTIQLSPVFSTGRKISGCQSCASAPVLNEC